MGRSERRAVLVLVAMAVAGHSLRWLVSRPDEPPGQIQLLPADPGGLKAHRDLVAQVSRPLGPDERVDIDRASAPELTRLPGIGPGLAKAIVADRARFGPFGSLVGLGRVRGIGPGILGSLEPYAAFSGPSGPVRATSPAQDPEAARSPVDLNQASGRELERLPQIGPARARAIVAYRELHGPFASLEELAAVPGIGQSVIERVKGSVIVR